MQDILLKILATSPYEGPIVRDTRWAVCDTINSHNLSTCLQEISLTPYIPWIILGLILAVVVLTLLMLHIRKKQKNK